MPPELSVSEFVGLLNQTLEFAYPQVVIVGELANFRVSKNRWVYFDLKDDQAVVRFFGTVYMLPGPLEDGMLLKVTGTPRMHTLYGFSINIQKIALSGEGTIKKAAQLLAAKLTAEGLFDSSRKRQLPYPPTRVGLITSSEAAAYTDFLKVLKQRWGGITIDFIDVQVQGEASAEQITKAINSFNQCSTPPDVLVITRGGGSTDDLQAFSTEAVIRAVAASRIPTLVAIGHERDISLAELAADRRASTPSNAAELLVPDRVQKLLELATLYETFQRDAVSLVVSARQSLATRQQQLEAALNQCFRNVLEKVHLQVQLLALLDPYAPLGRGYARIYNEQGTLRSISQLQADAKVHLQLYDGSAQAKIISVKAGS
jgi:exodeoxyribonuclease VII large subunit